MRVYAKNIYGVEDDVIKDVIKEFNALPRDFTPAQIEDFKRFTSFLRTCIDSENILSIGEARESGEPVIIEFDRKHEDGMFFVIDVDENGKMYIEITELGEDAKTALYK